MSGQTRSLACWHTGFIAALGSGLAGCAEAMSSAGAAAAAGVLLRRQRLNAPSHVHVTRTCCTRSHLAVAVTVTVAVLAASTPSAQSCNSFGRFPTIITSTSAELAALA